MPTTEKVLDAELAGLDRLEVAQEQARPLPARAWSAIWPFLAAIGISLGFWQLLVWSGWKPEFLLPPPANVFGWLADEITEPIFWQAIGTTMRRAVTGYLLALVVGGLLGCLVAALRPLRTAFGALITGLQTMPSIAWFPAAILLFGADESSIMFVVVIGAAPSIANGIIAGIDTVPPVLVRAGRVLGARGVRLYRKVVLPAALPNAISGLKQGWAFAWRSLMAGELLVAIANRPSVGTRMQFARDFDKSGLYGWMLVILVIGIVVELVLFGRLERAVLRRRGLGAQAR